MTFELKECSHIRAKIDLKCISNCYNTPELIEIKKGTVLELPNEGTSRGDVFCNLIDGNALIHLRGYGREGQLKPITVNNKNYNIGLIDGVNTRHPYDLGLADENYWEKL